MIGLAGMLTIFTIKFWQPASTSPAGSSDLSSTTTSRDPLALFNQNKQVQTSRQNIQPREKLSSSASGELCSCVEKHDEIDAYGALAEEQAGFIHIHSCAPYSKHLENSEYKSKKDRKLQIFSPFIILKYVQ